MLHRKVDRWERSFRAAAKRDTHATLRAHLQRLDLSESAELLLEGTVQAVRACSHYYALDHHDAEQFEQFLKMQQYQPGDVGDACYAFTLDLCGKAFARVLVDAKIRVLDLADLYGNPWQDYEVVGYHRLWISRIDWRELTGAEIGLLEDEVTRDLRFDYSEDELDLWFDDSLDETYLLVGVQDVEGSEEDNE